MLPNNQHHQKNQYNNQFVGAGGFSQNNLYNIFPEEASKVYGSKRGKDRRYDSQAWADKYYDEDKDPASKYANGQVSTATGRGVLTIPGNDTAKKEKMFMRPINTYSSETFQAPTSGSRISKATPTKVVIARNSGTTGEKKEPEQRMTILKPVGQLPTNVPVILSRANADSNAAKGVPASSSMAVL